MNDFFKDLFSVFNYVPACVYVWISVPECRCPQKAGVLDYPAAGVTGSYNGP